MTAASVSGVKGQDTYFNYYSGYFYYEEETGEWEMNCDAGRYSKKA